MGNDQAAAAEIVAVEVTDAVGIVTMRTPALSKAAKERLLAALRQRCARKDARRLRLADGFARKLPGGNGFDGPAVAIREGRRNRGERRSPTGFAG